MTVKARYDAFISYSHAADGTLAQRLESALQRFAKPWHRRRALSIFRDGNNLNLTPHLWSAIQSALGEAGHLVLLASPEAARSVWVGREVQHWLQQRGLEKLFIVVTAGSIAWDEGAGDFDWARTDCLPHALAGVYAGEPFFLDLRWARTAGTDLSLRNARFASDVALLAATLHGRSVEDMAGEELAQHRRTTRWRNGAIAALSLLLVAALAATWQAVQQQREAVAQRLSAEQQRDRAEAAALLTRVRAELQGNAVSEAVRWALAAAQRHPEQPAAREAVNAVGLHAGAPLLELRRSTRSPLAVQVSADGQRLLTVDADKVHAPGMKEAWLYDAAGRRLRVWRQVVDAHLVAGGQRVTVTRVGALAATVMPDGSRCGGSQSVEIHAAVYAPVEQGKLARYFASSLQSLSADGRRAALLCGNWLIVRDEDGTLREAAAGDTVAARLSPDGRFVVVESKTSARLIAVEAWSPAVTPNGSTPGAASGSSSGAPGTHPPGDRSASAAAASASARAPPPLPRGIELAGTAAVFSPDSTRLATVLGAESLLWDVSGRPLAKRKGTAPHFVTGDLWLTRWGDASLLWSEGAAEPVRLAGADAQVSADGRWVMTSSDDGRLRIGTAQGDPVVRLPGQRGRFSPLGPSVVAVDASGTVRVWDLRRLGLESMAAATLLWGTPQATGLAEANPALSRLLRPVTPAPAADGTPHPCAGAPGECSPEGDLLVDTSIMGMVPGSVAIDVHLLRLVADTQGRPQLVPPEGAPVLRCAGPRAAVAFSPLARGPWAIGCADGWISLVNRQREVLWRMQQTGAAVSMLSFTADGRRLLAGSDDGVVVMREASDGTLLHVVPGHDSAAMQAVVDGAGRTLATLTRQGVAHFWSLASTTSRLIGTTRNEGDAFARIQLSDDGQWLFAATESGALHRRWAGSSPAVLASQYPWLRAADTDEEAALGRR